MRRVLLVIAAFALLYNISFIGAESLSTARLAVVAMAVYLVVNGQPFYQQRDWVILLLFIPVPYVLAQTAFSQDFGQLSRFIHLALYAYLGANMLARIVGDLEEMLVIILGAVVLQSLLIVISFVNLDYRAWFDATVASGSNYEALYLYRAPGLASAGGSALSMVQSMGVVAGGLLLHVRRMRGVSLQSSWVLPQMLLCLLSTVFVGRTGLLLAVIFLVIHCVHAGVWRGLIVTGLLIGVPVGFVIGPYIELLLPEAFSVDYFVNWAFGFFFSGSDASVTDLATMPVPPLSWETFIGTGLVSLTAFGNPSGHDSGVVQAYYAMGLPVACLFYLTYSIVLWRTLSWLPLMLRFTVSAAMLAIELKEPFVFKYSSMVVLLAIYTLAKQDTGGRSGARQR